MGRRGVGVGSATVEAEARLMAKNKRPEHGMEKYGWRRHPWWPYNWTAASTGA
jgi:hypothetical protein